MGRKSKAPTNRRLHPSRFSVAAPLNWLAPWRAGAGPQRERLVQRLARYRSLLGVFAQALTALAVLAGSMAVGRLIEQYARTSPAFAVKEIEIKGLSRLTREQVLAQAGLALGRNVFMVGAEEAESRLLAYPWIASAAVKRRLPGSYSIEVRERRAVALLLMGDLFLVAADGAVFKRLEEGDPYDLPLITGLDQEIYTSDRELRASALINAVALLDDYSDAGLWRREPVSEIHLEADQSVSLYIGADAVNVRLGRRPFRAKLQRLRQVLDSLQRKSARAAYVYLDNVQRPDRVTVKLR